MIGCHNGVVKRLKRELMPRESEERCDARELGLAMLITEYRPVYLHCAVAL